MAAISSQILSQTMIEDALLQHSMMNPNTDTSAGNIPNPVSEAVQNGAEEASSGQNTLSEIQAIQQAILGEDFDFSTLEAPAAGNNSDQALNQSSEKTFSSPLLLQDDDLLISFRNDAGIDRESQLNDTASNTTSNSNSANRPYFDEAISIDTSADGDALPGTNQINGFLSEDFITQTQGSFDAELDISAQTINTAFGTFTSNDEGQWSYQLNNSAVEVQSLAAGQTVSDRISVSGGNGESVELIFSIQGNNDQAVITGQKTGSVQASTLTEQTDATLISGKLDVSDIDTAEAGFIANTNLTGSFGSAEINALGEWRYSLNNDSDAVLGLKSGEKLFDLFSVKTVDGSKQLIQITIEGVDDKPVLGGNNLGVLDLESQLGSTGSLTISDPDFGESTFQEASDILSSLGYGYGSINAQGEWQFNLDTRFTEANPIDQGDSRVDSFEVFTADGTSQTILIPIQGSDQPLFAQASSGTNSLQLGELLSSGDVLDDFNAHGQTANSYTSQATETLLSNSYHNEPSNSFTQNLSQDIGLI